MPSNTTTPAVLTDEQVIDALSTALDAAKVELAEIDPRRDALVARIAQLESTIAVFKGEQPPAAPKRRASKRRPRAATSDAPAPAAPVEGSVRAQRAAKRAAKEAAQQPAAS